MTREELRLLLDELPRVRVAIIGDFCLDAYWFIDLSRSEVSLETGVKTSPIRRQRYTLGGAGNVVMNLLDLGVGRIHVFGVVGADPFGPEMLRLLGTPRVDATGMLTQETDWSTHVYVKPHIGDEEQSRQDFGNFNVLADVTAAALLSRLEAALPAVDVVIVNEQVVTGLHASPVFQAGLTEMLRRHPARLFLLDSRHYSDRYDGTVRKTNSHEAARLCGIERAPGEIVLHGEARQAAETLHRRWGRPLFITRGPRGCLVHDGNGLAEVPGLQLLGRTDPVGAGDSMLAGIAAAMGAGRDCVTAATLGNFVAGVTAQKLFQTGTATPDEVMAIGADPDYVYRPELAEDPRAARYLEGSEIEVITEVPRDLRQTHAVFDHDGTISTLRQGWEQIMEPMMVRAILGPRFEQADESLYQKVVGRVRDFIAKTTGVQTITQMKGLADMVREFRCVPEAEILDAAGYKAVYNEALMRLVRERVAKLERGELNADDYTLKNAVAFLRRLRKQGLRLVLASGTDEADVRREAAALGYAEWFDGGIHGSVGAVERDAKKVVLDRILNELGTANARHVITFGDGPVEIRETHKRGGFTVGVASDEVRRFGLNTEKRTRLIRAGADLIVPDFSQMDRLLAAINCNGP
jgi:bifunctional ADP-heptose synthase (sugar kinase/adenylyltransferase)/phosphoglycolate phosphatase-like HAD superfamily hydrolase